MERFFEPDHVRRYLLGDLDPQTQQRLEERLLTDADFYEELLASEEELVEEYLGGALTADERRRFETVFLAAPERQRKLAFAHAFRRYAASSEAAAGAPAEDPAAQPHGAPSPSAADAGARRPSFWERLFPPAWGGAGAALRFGAAAVMLLLAVLVGVLVYRTARTDSRRAAAQELARLNDPRRQGDPAGGFLPLTLTRGLTRAEGQTSRVRVPAGAPGLRLRLELPNGASESYRARLQTADEPTRSYTVDGLRPDASGGARAVVLYVPAELLPPGDYQVKLGEQTLDGDFEDAGTYSFRVTND